jgi:hypothetical protein
MKTYGRASNRETASFLKEHSIDRNVDWNRFTGRGQFANLFLAKLDDQGETTQHIEDTGACYDFSRLDYFTLGRESRTIASRYVATIQPSKRTELTYRTETAPVKNIAVHKGLGRLVIGRSSTRTSYGETTIFELDPEVTPQVRLPSGSFYFFESSKTHSEELVVSGFYEGEVDWESLEISVSPNDERIQTPQGEVIVPLLFKDRASAS